MISKTFLLTGFKVLQELAQGQYLAPLKSSKLTEDVITNRLEIEDCYLQCQLPQGYYTKVSFKALQAYINNKEVMKALAPYGKIIGDVVRLPYKKYHDLAGLENGNGMVAMILDQSMPYSFKIDGQYCQVIHNN